MSTDPNHWTAWTDQPGTGRADPDYPCWPSPGDLFEAPNEAEQAELQRRLADRLREVSGPRPASPAARAAR
jgi:hypothetical protein